MKTLHLQLIKQWFSMVQSGEKKEEYRDITKYWISRLISFSNQDSKKTIRDIELGLILSTPIITKNIFHTYGLSFRDYDQIHFKNGYARNGKPAPQFDTGIKGIRIGKGRHEWGASGANQFIIELGDIKK